MNRPCMFVPIALPNGLGPVGKHYCGKPAAVAVLEHNAEGVALGSIGRERIVRSYCPEHGGFEAALANAKEDWNYLAPASVGDRFDVQEAGLLSLTTTEYYVVIRKEQDMPVPKRFRVSFPKCPLLPKLHGPQEFRSLVVAEDLVRRLADAGTTAAIDELPAAVLPRPRPYAVSLGIGTHMVHVAAFATRQEALERGTAAWDKNLARKLAAIRKARGGTLSWGFPVKPCLAPTIVEPLPGECAWDAVARMNGTPRAVQANGA